MDEMGVYYLPAMLQKQLEVVDLLLQIRLLSYEDKRELEKIKRNLKYNIHPNSFEKNFLEKIITKYGYLVN